MKSLIFVRVIALALVFGAQVNCVRTQSIVFTKSGYNAALSATDQISTNVAFFDWCVITKFIAGDCWRLTVEPLRLPFFRVAPLQKSQIVSLNFHTQFNFQSEFCID